MKNKQKLKFSIFEKLIHEIVEDFAVQKFKEFETSRQVGHLIKPFHFDPSTTGTVFMTLYFLGNLHIGIISQLHYTTL